MKRRSFLLGTLALAACGQSNTPTAMKWYIQYGDPNVAWLGDGFIFPQNDDGVHYVSRTGDALRAGMTMNLSFNLSGEGTLAPVAGSDSPPPTIALYFQRKGDTMGLTNYRWWGIPRIPVDHLGDYSMSIVIAPENWSNLYGQVGTTVPSEFQAAINEVWDAGFTFGGQSFAGHGVKAVGGPVRFTLKGFSIT